MKIFGREPSVYISIIGAVLSYLVMRNIDGLSDVQAAAIMGALTALVGAINGAMVRPFSPAFANGAIAAVAGLLVAYGMKVSPDEVTALQAVAVAVGGLWAVRPAVTPKADPLPGGGVPDRAAGVRTTGPNPLR